MWIRRCHIEAFTRELSAIRARLKTLEGKVTTMAIDTTALMAAVGRLEADDKAAIAALTALRDQNKATSAQLADVSKQLADLQASGTTDTSAIQGQLNDAAARLGKVADDVEAGVAANPAVPNMAPAPAPDAPAQ